MIELGVFRNSLPHKIGGLDKVVAQIRIASFRQMTILSFKVTRVIFGPPQTSDLGDGILGITQGTRPIAFAFFVPLAALPETVGVTDFGSDATS